MGLPLGLIDLAGFVALLIWGTRMVRTGLERAFGDRLRAILGRALRNRLGAFAAGLGITTLLQSSTATALMTAGFAASGAVGLVPALAVMLGANVGTTLIVQLLSFDVAALAPLAILVGVVLFRQDRNRRARPLGRVAIGVGLMLLALHELTSLMSGVEETGGLRLVLAAVAASPVIDLVLAAGLTWALHSSVAVVLLVMSLASKGAIAPEAALAMVLGANLGTAINPVIEGPRSADPAVRRLPVGNLMTRMVGAALALVAIGPTTRLVLEIVPEPARAVADFHTLFNVAVAALVFPLLSPFAAVLERLLPSRADPTDRSVPVHLDPVALETPVVALGAATREALRVADELGAMLAGARAALASADRAWIAETSRHDDVLDRLTAAIKSYLTALDPQRLGEAQQRRVEAIIGFTTSLERAGDVVDRMLLAHAGNCLKRGVVLAPEQRAELFGLLDRLGANLKTASSLFIGEDARTAATLAHEKIAFRDAECRADRKHLERLRAGELNAIRASGLYLDLMGDLKLISGHIVAASAYPILEREGALLPSRIVGFAPDTNEPVAVPPERPAGGARALPDPVSGALSVRLPPATMRQEPTPPLALAGATGGPALLHAVRRPPWS